MISDMLPTALLVLIAMVLVLIVLVRIHINIRIFIYFTVASLFVPLNIQFMGKDALTTGTVAILCLYLFYMADLLKKGRIFDDRMDLLIYAVILHGLLSTAIGIDSGFLDNEQVGSAVRQYVGFSSSLIFYMILKNYRPEEQEITAEGDSVGLHVEKIFAIMAFMISLHIVLSIVIYFVPSLGPYFEIFYGKDYGVLDTALEGASRASRISSFVFSPEQYGEILAFLSPIIIYKALKPRNPLWVLCLLLFIAGLLFAVTRSGILLFVVGAGACLIYNLRERFARVYLMVCSMMILLAIVVIFYPAAIEPSVQRFSLASETYSSSGGFFEVINRDNFPEFWDYVLLNLSLFGHSLYRVDFHNLYMTTLHQLGVIGSLLFFIVLFYPLFQLVRSYRSPETNFNKALLFSCIISMLIFFINEAKFEFTRTSSYVEICWAIFAMYSLVSKAPMTRME